jgi:hypothetical protein
MIAPLRSRRCVIQPAINPTTSFAVALRDDRFGDAKHVSFRCQGAIAQKQLERPQCDQPDDGAGVAIPQDFLPDVFDVSPQQVTATPKVQKLMIFPRQPLVGQNRLAKQSKIPTARRRLLFPEAGPSPQGSGMNTQNRCGEFLVTGRLLMMSHRAGSSRTNCGRPAQNLVGFRGDHREHAQLSPSVDR